MYTQFTNVQYIQTEKHTAGSVSK